MKMKKDVQKKGFSLIEILVVVAIFAALAGIAAQSIAYSLRGARKTDSTADVRENLDFAMAIIERQLRNAQEITSACDTTAQSISYKDHQEVDTSFSCIVGVDGYISSGSARLTSDNISITNCSFTCTSGASSSLPPAVDISFTGEKKDAGTFEGASASLQSRVNLRVY